MSTCQRGPSQRTGTSYAGCSDGDLEAAALGTGLVTVFQPIVSLPDGDVVGYEALTRWPDLAGCAPGRVFGHAAAVGDAHALDQLCIDSALLAATGSHLPLGTLLCINAEPSTPYVGCADDVVLARGRDELTVMFELTERRMLAHPQALLRKVAAMRSDGFIIALDDVGAHPDSLALLDIIRPDVIKLDLAMVQTQPSHDQARTLAAVLAHCERTGAIILAEGIESDVHREQAMAVGATLGQGFLFGRPGPIAQRVTAPRSVAASTSPQTPCVRSPFDLVAGTSPVRTARQSMLTALSHHIETQARFAVDPPMVFTALQRREYFVGATRDGYRTLAGACPLVAIFGEDLPADLGSGVRGVELDPADPLCAEWTVVALGPHSAAALIARERDDNADLGRRGDDRRFDFVTTYDRSLVTEATRGLLDRMA